jgi:hypothetical protein
MADPGRSIRDVALNEYPGCGCDGWVRKTRSRAMKPKDEVNAGQQAAITEDPCLSA